MIRRGSFRFVVVVGLKKSFFLLSPLFIVSLLSSLSFLSLSLSPFISFSSQVRERLRSAQERNMLLEDELMLAQQEVRPVVLLIDQSGCHI